MDECTESPPRRGWVFYDGECGFCRRLVGCVRARLERRGFGFAPLQSPGVRARLGLSEAELLSELRVLRADGRRLGGAAAVVEIARQVWWGWPLAAFARLPGAGRLLAAGYRWVAGHRRCAS